VHEVAIGVERTRDIRRQCLAGIRIARREGRQGVRFDCIECEVSSSGSIIDAVFVVLVLLVNVVVWTEEREEAERQVQEGRRPTIHASISVSREGRSSPRGAGHGRGRGLPHPRRRQYVADGTDGNEEARRWLHRTIG
jgi:hypothetical protein